MGLIWICGVRSKLRSVSWTVSQVRGGRVIKRRMKFVTCKWGVSGSSLVGGSRLGMRSASGGLGLRRVSGGLWL